MMLKWIGVALLNYTGLYALIQLLALAGNSNLALGVYGVVVFVPALVATAFYIRRSHLSITGKTVFHSFFGYIVLYFLVALSGIGIALAAYYWQTRAHTKLTAAREEPQRYGVMNDEEVRRVVGED